MRSFIATCLFLFVFLLTTQHSPLQDVNAVATFPTSSFIVYPIANDTTTGVFVLPLSTNLSVTLDPSSYELLGNITIYPINLDTSIDTSEFPLCFYNLQSLSFSIPLTILETILPASGYNITYTVISPEVGKSGLSSSLVFVSSDANSTTVLVTTDDATENSWSRHFSRNASNYAAGTVLGLLLLTLFGLAVCSLATDPSCYPQSSYYYPYPQQQQQPLVMKKKKHKKSHKKKKHHRSGSRKKKVARDADRDRDRSSSSSSSSDSDSDDKDIERGK